MRPKEGGDLLKHVGVSPQITVLGGPAAEIRRRQRARASEGLSARTYVTCATDPANRVVGYYAISTAAAHRVAMPNAKLRQGMEEVPLLLLGRLAVDAAFQGQGLGAALLADALRRCAAASVIAGIRGLLAHAIDDAAVRFYLSHGFAAAPPLGERTMLMPIEVLRAAVNRPRE